ncbi:hypothetical protein Atai01_59150 [Amycolatopsis taiwanensis]|uniref:Uncharacterized protein n=1 Tax=Amycolatopsis taiwanensis TaxID=342230 RepID=A0A9W6R4F7_9PSEU|nr:hypothetical protein Atai01_59150 [Amycolatopsis taiwanensis]
MARELHRGPTRSRSHPVVVVEGARGYGKTALLDALAHGLDQRVPYARVNFESHRAASVPEVLSAIAFQLGKTCDRYGSLRFPLLTIGRKVMRAKLPESRPEAREAVRRLLAEQVDLEAMRSILFDAAGALAQTLSPDDSRGFILRILLRLGLEGLSRVIRHAKSLSPDWYGHRDRGLKNNGLDVLVDLNAWVKDGSTFEINELLWDAFLTDLRDNFQNSGHAAEMTLNCVVLLDDADTPLGQEFLNGLVYTRESRVVLGMDPGDPMTTVATSRGELLSEVGPRGLVEFTNRKTDRSLRYDPQGEPNWWCRYRLADLSESEAGIMVSSLPPNTDGHVQPIAGHQLTSMVYSFTGGHPASTAMLVEATSKRPLKFGSTLAVLLDRPESGHDADRPPLGESLRRQLLGEFTVDTYRDLVTCAAARTRQHASLLAARGELLVGGLNSYQEIAPVLWPASGGAGPNVLRRLLLRELAARSDDETANWTKVVEWLRARCEEDADDEGVLHYALANGDIATTCEGLRQRLTADDPVGWVRLLRSVTSMPRRPVPSADSEVPPMDQLAAAIDNPSSRLHRLVVARWIVFDPFISNRRRALHRRIAADYDFVAGLAQGDPEPLLNEADYHRRQAELWS